MNISEFVSKAKEQDARNIFETAENIPSLIPIELKEFYKKHNPIDVEVEIGGNATHFYPIDDLEDLQNDYHLGNDCFVFATCNGDPIFYKSNGIFTCVHGTKKITLEKLAESFEKYLGKI